MNWKDPLSRVLSLPLSALGVVLRGADILLRVVWRARGPECAGRDAVVHPHGVVFVPWTRTRETNVTSVVRCCVPWAVLGGAMLLSPLVVRGQVAVRADSSADVRGIVAARARSNAAIARHDTAGIAREMMPDVTVVSSTSAMGTGVVVNVSKMAAQFARRPDTRWVRTPDTIAVFDAWGVASERGQWVGTWTEPDGPVAIRGSYEAQWRRQDGTWRIQGELFVPLRCEGGAYCRARPQ